MPTFSTFPTEISPEYIFSWDMNCKVTRIWQRQKSFRSVFLNFLLWRRCWRSSFFKSTTFKQQTFCVCEVQLASTSSLTFCEKEAKEEELQNNGCADNQTNFHASGEMSSIQNNLFKSAERKEGQLFRTNKDHDIWKFCT